MMKKIYFRADAGADIGYGHFIRSLALADMLKSDFECVMFTQEPTPYQISEAENVCQLVSLPADESKFDIFLTYLTGDEIVVLDNYFYTTNYQQQIKDKGCKLVCIDDMHDKHFVADVIINHGHVSVEEYDVEPYTQLCLGTKWRLIRSAFLTKYIEKEPGCWFVSFGGTDYYNLTERFVQQLQLDTRVQSILVVVGDAYKFMDSLSNYSKAKVFQNVSAVEMATLMQRAEFAIVPHSSVCMEALVSECQVGTGYFVDNQMADVQWAKKIGYTLSFGDLRLCDVSKVVDDLLEFKPSCKLEFHNIISKYLNLFHKL